MTAEILAAPAMLGHGVLYAVGPAVISLSILTWLGLTLTASFRTIHPGRRHDQSPHRGPIEGGLYRYSPGMYSHSYPPGYFESANKAMAAEKARAESIPAAVVSMRTGRTVEGKLSLAKTGPKGEPASKAGLPYAGRPKLGVPNTGIPSTTTTSPGAEAQRADSGDGGVHRG